VDGETDQELLHLHEQAVEACLASSSMGDVFSSPGDQPHWKGHIKALSGLMPGWDTERL
jgi:hypothetical protein